MSRPLALAAALLLLAPLAPLGAGASLSIASEPTLAHVQKMVDSMLRIAEVRQAFEDGDRVVVKVSSGVWHGTMRGGSLELSGGSAPSPTHTLSVDPTAMRSIINAYDTGNTMKLAVKGQFMTASSERATVNTAIGAMARTPLDDRLPTRAPAAGDSITHQGCTGTLVAADPGFKAELCGSNYTVTTLGGVVAKIAPPHLVNARVFNVTLHLDSSYAIDEVAAESYQDAMRADICRAASLGSDSCSRVVVNFRRLLL